MFRVVSRTTVTHSMIGSLPHVVMRGEPIVCRVVSQTNVIGSIM